MRSNLNRNLILLITSMTMLTITIIAGCTTPTPTATFISITPDQCSSTVISSYGLSLTLSLNSTTYHPGEQVSVTIDEKNILAVENSIHAADKWPVQGLRLGPCRTVYPFGISILQGYYDAKNVAAVAPLHLFDPNAMPSCAAIPPAVYYNFQPWSDVATIYPDNFEPYSVNMTAKVVSAGFWTGRGPNATFSNFTPGIYTIVGGDEWGALVILHFTVSGCHPVSASQNGEPVEIVSVLGPLRPFNPGGPGVEITLKNVGVEPVISLAATLELDTPFAPFDFTFDVTPANPLQPNRSTSARLTLIGGGFTSGNVSYPLTINTTLQNGANFVYTKLVQIENPR